MTCGIYAIVHSKTKRLYIGSSVIIERRIRKHFKSLREGHHHSRYLLRFWNKYGEDAFTTVILEKCSKDKLLEREQHYLDLHKSYQSKRGFNCCHEAGRPSEAFTNRTFEDLSKQAKQMWANPEIRAKLLAAHAKRRGKPSGGKGRKASEETKIKMSLARKKWLRSKKAKKILIEIGLKRKERFRNDRDFRNKVLEVLQKSRVGRVATEATRKKRSIKLIARWADPELGKKLIARSKSPKELARLRAMAGSQTLEQRMIISKKLKACWKDPAWRENQLAKQKKRKRSSNGRYV